MENKVTGSLNPDNKQTIALAINTIQQELPFLIELSPAEAKRVVRMEAGRADFVRKALLLAGNNTRLQPQFFELAEMERDIDLCHQLDGVLANIDKLYKQIVDTRDQAGYEAYSAALEIYNMSKRGTSKGIPGAQTAYEELSGLFSMKPRSTPPKESKTDHKEA